MVAVLPCRQVNWSEDPSTLLDPQMLRVRCRDAWADLMLRVRSGAADG